MSFEDDMIEEGFDNEQDYLDYICNKADSRYYHDFMDEEEREYQNNSIAREREYRIRFNKILQQWKESNVEDARLWSIIWNYNKNQSKELMDYEENEFAKITHYTPIELLSISDTPDEGSWWTLWKRSSEAFINWKDGNKGVWDSLIERTTLEETKGTFSMYCNHHNIEELFLLCHVFMDNHCFSLKTVKEVEKEAIIKGWRDNFVHDKSKEAILFDYWKEKNNKEWLYWLRVNYPYIRYLALNAKSYLNKKNYFLENWEFYLSSLQNVVDYYEYDEEYKQYLSLNHLDDVILEDESDLFLIVKEQVSDWWHFYVEDIIFRHQCEFVDISNSFLKDGETAVLGITDESIKQFIKEEITHLELDTMEFGQDDEFSCFIDKQRLNNTILPKSFNLDRLFSDEWDNEDLDDPDSGPLPIIDMSVLKGLDELMVDMIEEKPKEDSSKSYRANLKSLYSTDFQEYLLALTSTSDERYLSYRETQLIKAVEKHLVFYFLRGHFNQDMVGVLTPGIIDYQSIKKKEYSNITEIITNECSLSGFNTWCKKHRLPSFVDYVFKHWVDELNTTCNYTLYIWLTYWRGEEWIKYLERTQNKYRDFDDNDLFLKWKENHSKEWEKWYLMSFEQFVEKYRYVEAFSRLVREGNPECIAFLNQDNNPVKRILSEKEEGDYYSWLSKSYSSSEIEDNGLLNRHHPLYKVYKDKKYRAILNKKKNTDCWAFKDIYNNKKDCPVVYGIDNLFHCEYSYKWIHCFIHELIEERYPQNDDKQ